MEWERQHIEALRRILVDHWIVSIIKNGTEQLESKISKEEGFDIEDCIKGMVHGQRRQQIIDNINED